MQRQLVSYSKYSKLEYNNYKKIDLSQPRCWQLHGELEALLDELEEDSREGGTSTVALLRGPLFGAGLPRQFSMLPFRPGTLPQI